jgi:hypothetical protein
LIGGGNGLPILQGSLDKGIDSVTAWPAQTSLSHSEANEASRLVKSAPGKLLYVVGYNSKVSAQWIQIHNAASAPANGSVPVLTQTVPASSNFAIPLPDTGLDLDVGIVVANSTTATTLTAGSTDIFVTAIFI